MKIIELQTHVGPDMDSMCLFLNANRIGCSVGECHHLTGCSRFKDYPHYTAFFTLGGYSDEGLVRVMDTIKGCKNITYYMEIVIR